MYVVADLKESMTLLFTGIHILICENIDVIFVSNHSELEVD